MTRETNTYSAGSVSWVDRTLSMLQARQLEACEERIASLPSFGLFSGCDDTNAEVLWRISHDAEEHPRLMRLHSAEELRRQVLRNLRLELALLPLQEYELIHRLLASGGETELYDWSETVPAESLVRRLWCTLTDHGEDGMTLRLPRELYVPMAALIAGKPHQELREKVTGFYLTVMCVLNTYGIVAADDVLAWLRQTVLTDPEADDPELALRMLRTGFDTAVDHQGRLVLTHPGVADLEAMLPNLVPVQVADFAVTDFTDDIPQIQLSDGERSACVLMAGLMDPVLRPELIAPTAVEDLRILAKQGVSLEAMAEVLASQVTVRPGKDLLDGLRILRSQTPAWVCAPTRMVQ